MLLLLLLGRAQFATLLGPAAIVFQSNIVRVVFGIQNQRGVDPEHCEHHLELDRCWDCRIRHSLGPSRAGGGDSRLEYSPCSTDCPGIAPSVGFFGCAHASMHGAGLLVHVSVDNRGRLVRRNLQVVKPHIDQTNSFKRPLGIYWSQFLFCLSLIFRAKRVYILLLPMWFANIHLSLSL